MARYALLLASNGPGELAPLRYALHDQAALADTLRMPAYDFKVETSGDAEPIEACRARVERACENAGPGDTLLIYFAGHGLLHKGSLRLLWHATSRERLLSSSISAATLFEAMASSDATNRLLLLDCCHAEGAVPRGARAMELKPIVQVPSEAFLLVMASGRLESAREFPTLGGGFMTQALCGSLRDAARAGRGRVTLSDVMSEMSQHAAQHNAHAAPENRVPVPRQFGSSQGEFLFSQTWDVWQPHFVTHGQLEFALLPVRASFDTAWVIGRLPLRNKDVIGIPRASLAGGRHFDASTGDFSDFDPAGNALFNGTCFPAVCLSFDDAQIVAQHYGALDGPLIDVCVVPTTIWEYAAGLRVADDPTTSIRPPAPRGHFDAESPADLSRVGRVENGFGVVDIWGNVWEWCEACRPLLQRTLVGNKFSKLFFVERADLAPNGLDTGEASARRRRELTVDIRGGSFLTTAAEATRAARAADLPLKFETRDSDLGVRLAGQVPFHALPPEITRRLMTCPIYEIEYEPDE